jgi:hypothetical protein
MIQVPAEYWYDDDEHEDGLADDGLADDAFDGRLVYIPKLEGQAP